MSDQPQAKTTTPLKAARQNPPNRHSRRWLPWLGAVVLVALIAAGLWPKPEPVETTRATVGTLRATVNEEGRTRIRQRYLVCAPVAGQLRRLPFKAGAEIQADQTVLAVIDPLSPALLDARARALAEARRDTAAASVEKARASQTFAASELRRFKNLFTDKTVTIQDLESVQWREEAARRDLAAAESALREAEAALAEFAPGAASAREPVEVRAPASGRVLRIVEESARVVAAGTPLMEVGDPADLEVIIDVLSRDGAIITPGTKIELEQWGGGPALEARVRLVEPAAFTKVSALGVEEQRVNVIADIVTPPEQRRGLGDQFRVEARIITWETDRALKVPSGALFRRGQAWAALAVVNGKAELRSVKAGRSSGAETQVLEGVKEGDELILYPGDRVQPGQRVRTVKI